ncbi:MAG: recombinase family protein, partial [Clostridia bacterium]|nr:recombinase family protein [Clostridia bacterium]
IESFLSFGIEPKRIYSDKKSGADFDRHNYARLIKKLKRGDLLVIKSIDRLGRNYTAIIEEWNRITNVIGADIVVLDMPLLDTRDKGISLVGKFISDIVLQVLSFVAQNERENIRARQAEGIAAARKKGVRFGRPVKQLSPQLISLICDCKNGKISAPEAIKQSGVTRGQFYYQLRKAKTNDGII